MNSDGSSSRLPSSPSEETPPKGERKEVRLLKQRNRRDDALALFVLSGLCFTLSVAFFILSFRYNYLREKIFTPASVEFVVFVICISLSAICFGVGMYKFQSSKKIIEHLNEK